jgi:hypothetical protein
MHKTEGVTLSMMSVLQASYTAQESMAHHWLDLLHLHDRNFAAIGLTGSRSLILRIPVPDFKKRHEVHECALLEEIMLIAPLETMTLLADRFLIEAISISALMARAQVDVAFRPLLSRLALTDRALKEASQVWYLGTQTEDRLSKKIADFPDVAPRILARQMAYDPRLKKMLMDLATMHAKLAALANLLWCGLGIDEVKNLHNGKKTAEFMQQLESGHGLMRHLHRGREITRIAQTPLGGTADPL